MAGQRGRAGLTGDPKIYRILSWRSKVERALSRSTPRRKGGDDYAARM
jgi:hypothetical protein